MYQREKAVDRAVFRAGLRKNAEDGRRQYDKEGKREVRQKINARQFHEEVEEVGEDG